MEEPRNKPILIGVAFLLPLMFIVVVFLSSYVPSIRLSTDYNFVYATCSEGIRPYYYNCGNYLNARYGVENGTLQELPIPPELDSDNDDIPDINENYRTRLFIHDTELDESREITLDEVQQLNLRNLITSPDGVAVEWEASGRNGFFLFYSSSSNYGYYLTKGNAHKRLNLINDSERSYYRDDFEFLGWIVE